MDYFGKPTAYKNLNSSQFTNIRKIKSTTEKLYNRLLEQISSHSPEKGTCTCS